MAKRPWFWGGHDVMALEFRELREKDFETLGPELGCSTVRQFQRLVDTRDVTVATNLGQAVGWAYGDGRVFAKLEGRGIEERLKRRLAR